MIVLATVVFWIATSTVVTKKDALTLREKKAGGTVVVKVCELVV